MLLNLVGYIVLYNHLHSSMVGSPDLHNQLFVSICGSVSARYPESHIRWWHTNLWRNKPGELAYKWMMKCKPRNSSYGVLGFLSLSWLPVSLSASIYHFDCVQYWHIYQFIYLLQDRLVQSVKWLVMEW